MEELEDGSRENTIGVCNGSAYIGWQGRYILDQKGTNMKDKMTLLIQFYHQYPGKKTCKSCWCEIVIFRLT